MATPLVLSNVGKLAENIVSANFRNEAHFKIAKSLRKKAYTQCLDVMIKSTDYNLYENYNANPSIKHYGYIQLVYQDAFSQIFPITQFRQRFLDLRQEQAIQMWKDWIKYYQQEYYFYVGEEQRQQIATAANVEDFVDSGFNPLTRSQFIGELGWIELPLREVHVKMLANCSFSVDYTQWQPVPFNELWSGLTSITGESQMEDGEKDDGIPDDSSPRKNPKSNPWDGTELPTSLSALAGLGLTPVSPDDWMPIIPPDVPATATTPGYYINVIRSFVDYNPCRLASQNLFYGCKHLSRLIVRPMGNFGSCGAYHGEDTYMDISDGDTNNVYMHIGNAYIVGTVVGVVSYGLLPPHISTG
jgi:hypothetical protein